MLICGSFLQQYNTRRIDENVVWLMVNLPFNSSHPLRGLSLSRNSPYGFSGWLGILNDSLTDDSESLMNCPLFLCIRISLSFYCFRLICIQITGPSFRSLCRVPFRWIYISCDCHICWIFCRTAGTICFICVISFSRLPMSTRLMKFWLWGNRQSIK